MIEFNLLKTKRKTEGKPVPNEKDPAGYDIRFLFISHDPQEPFPKPPGFSVRGRAKPNHERPGQEDPPFPENEKRGPANDERDPDPTKEFASSSYAAGAPQ